MSDDVFRANFENVDAVLIILATLGTTSWKIYDIAQWTNSTDYLLATFITFSLITSSIYAKVIKTRYAYSEKKGIQTIQAELELTRNTRNWLLNTSQLIDGIVGEKYIRLRKLLEQPVVKIADVFSREVAQKQIVLIVQAMHEFFSDQLDAKSSLRLGVYFRGDLDPDTLELGYSWDGNTQDCFSKDSSKYLKITRCGNVLSELAKCYHSDEGIIIVPNCQESLRRGEFHYFRPEQETRIRSLLVYRFNVTDRPGDHPWIIYLDTNQSGFFDVSKKPDYKLFFEGLCRRLSFELVTLELSNKVAL